MKNILMIIMVFMAASCTPSSPYEVKSPCVAAPENISKNALIPCVRRPANIGYDIV